MILRKINKIDNEDFAFFKEVYLTSFPLDERRPINSIERLVLSSPIFTLYIIENNEEKVGFITTWKNNMFTYMEHFAIAEDKRSGGIGAKAITQLLSLCELPMIIEVEPPTDTIAIRRISFYQRLGFQICDYDYTQPAYTPNQKSLKLKLMEYGGTLTAENPQNVETDLHIFYKQ